MSRSIKAKLLFRASKTLAIRNVTYRVDVVA